MGGRSYGFILKLRFLPPTHLGLRVSGYACACYALTGRSGFWSFFVPYPGFGASRLALLACYALAGRGWCSCTLGYDCGAPPVGGAQNSADVPSTNCLLKPIYQAHYSIFGTHVKRE